MRPSSAARRARPDGQRGNREFDGSWIVAMCSSLVVGAGLAGQHGDGGKGTVSGTGLLNWTRMDGHSGLGKPPHGQTHHSVSGNCLTGLIKTGTNGRRLVGNIGQRLGDEKMGKPPGVAGVGCGSPARTRRPSAARRPAARRRQPEGGQPELNTSTSMTRRPNYTIAEGSGQAASRSTAGLAARRWKDTAGATPVSAAGEPHDQCDVQRGYGAAITYQGRYRGGKHNQDGRGHEVLTG